MMGEKAIGNSETTTEAGGKELGWRGASRTTTTMRTTGRRIWQAGE